MSTGGQVIFGCPAWLIKTVILTKQQTAVLMFYLLFEARDEVTTVPALARVGGESICVTEDRGEDRMPMDWEMDSASTLPRVPETGGKQERIVIY